MYRDRISNGEYNKIISMVCTILIQFIFKNL